MRQTAKEPTTLKETIISKMGRVFFNSLDEKLKKEIQEIDSLRSLSEKKKISFDDLIPA